MNLNQNHRYLLEVCNGNVEHPDSRQGKIVAYDLNFTESDDIYAAEYRILWNDGTESYFGYQVLNGQAFSWSRALGGFIHVRPDKPPSYYDPNSGEMRDIQLTPA